MGFLKTVFAHRQRPWNKLLKMLKSVTKMRFSCIMNRLKPCGRRLKRLRRAWRSLPMTAGSWWSPSKPCRMSWTGIIGSLRTRATGVATDGHSREVACLSMLLTYLCHTFLLSASCVPALGSRDVAGSETQKFTTSWRLNTSGGDR